MTKRNSQSLYSTCLLTVSAAALFAGCASDASPEQEQNVEPLGSITLCLDVVAGVCALASDPAACELGLGGICPDVISVDVATCEAKFSSACGSFGLGQPECDAAATKACASFTTPGVCYDDTFNACASLGGTDALCDSVASALCSNPSAVSCDQFVDKLCAAIPLSATDCGAAHLSLCSTGTPTPTTPTPTTPNPTTPAPKPPTPTVCTTVIC